MAGRFLHVTKRHAGVERGGDEGVTHGMGPDPLSDPGPPCDTTHDPSGGVAVESLPGRVDEDRSVEAFTDSQVDRSGDPRGASGMVATLPPLRTTARR
jgi:hypothetical protein